MRRHVSLAVLATISALTAVGSISLLLLRPYRIATACKGAKGYPAIASSPVPQCMATATVHRYADQSPVRVRAPAARRYRDRY